jgi:20S proteasome subunit alpha 3
MKLVIKVLSKTMDSTTLSPEKVELATLARDEAGDKVGRLDWAGPGRGQGIGVCGH